MLNIKVTNKTFNQVKSNGSIFVLVDGSDEQKVTIKLGKEKEYIPNTRDDANTEKRLFKYCKVITRYQELSVSTLIIFC